MKCFITGVIIAVISFACSKTSNSPAPPPLGGSDTTGQAGGNPVVKHGYFLDNQFKPTGTFVSLVAPQKDGKIIIANPTGIGRINRDGSRDNGFAVSSCSGGEIHCLALQDDGKIIIGGDFLSFNGQSAPYLVRLNADGSRDNTISSASIYDESLIDHEDVKSLAIQKDGKIVLGGSFAWQTGPQQSGAIPHQVNLIRLNSNGSFDATLKPYTANYPRNAVYNEYSNNVTNVRMLPDGKLLVCGQSFVTVDAAGHIYSTVVKLNSDGTVATDFHWSADGLVSSYGFTPYPVIVDPGTDGNILMGGRFNLINNRAAYGLTHMDSKGAVDFDFNLVSYQIVEGICRLNDTTVFIGDIHDRQLATSNTGLTVLKGNGAVNRSYALAFPRTGDIYSIIKETDSTVLVAGHIETGKDSYSGLARVIVR